MQNIRGFIQRLLRAAQRMLMRLSKQWLRNTDLEKAFAPSFLGSLTDIPPSSFHKPVTGSSDHKRACCLSVLRPIWSASMDTRIWKKNVWGHRVDQRDFRCKCSKGFSISNAPGSAKHLSAVQQYKQEGSVRNNFVAKKKTFEQGTIFTANFYSTRSQFWLLDPAVVQTNGYVRANGINGTVGEGNLQ